MILISEVIEPGYAGLFAASFISATIIPFSSEALLIFMLMNGYDSWSCIITASVGNWMGGMSSYFLGYIGKWSWLEKYFGVKETDTIKWKQKINKYGVYFAFLCWLPVVGDVIAVALGFSKSNKYFVALYMFIGKCFRYIFLAYSLKLYQCDL
jgi:membrane protein YqaA with SNARE-associated domain